MAIIETNKLTKIYRTGFRRKETRALIDLDLTVPEGGIFGLLGPNGSGKTTTIKLLLGLIHPTRGEARLLGEAPGHRATREKLGYLPEHSHHHAFLTARESLHFYGRLSGISRAERKERIPELLEQVGLSHAADRRAGGFSKGMSRRLGLAQALLHRPELLILDEPTSGLDPVGTREIQDLLLQLARDEGTTILLTSHLLSEIEIVCSRIAVLNRGRLMREGTVDDLLTQGDERVVRLADLSAEAEEELARHARELGARVLGVETPKVPLEKYFLQMIDEAESEEEDEA